MDHLSTHRDDGSRRRAVNSIASAAAISVNDLPSPFPRAKIGLPSASKINPHRYHAPTHPKPGDAHAPKNILSPPAPLANPTARKYLATGAPIPPTLRSPIAQLILAVTYRSPRFQSNGPPNYFYPTTFPVNPTVKKTH